MKNKIFATILIIFLLLPVGVMAEEDIVSPLDEQPAVENVADTQQLDEDVDAANVEEQTAEPEISSSSALPHKQPISKKRILKKFLLAMLGVAISSFVLYFGLTLYNKIREGFANKVKTPEGETPLNTPDNIEGAVKTFLDKTKW